MTAHLPRQDDKLFIECFSAAVDSVYAEASRTPVPR